MSMGVAAILGVSFVVGCVIIAIGLEGCGINAARIMKGLNK